MNILVTYISMTGRNEKIAKHLVDYLEEHNADVTLEQMIETDAFALDSYDAVIVETYTYNDGEIPDEAQDFYDDLKDVDLNHTKFAVLGSSSKQHLHFGRAVDYFTMQLNSSNGEQVADSVKIDQDPDEDDFRRVDQLADYVLKSLK
ncbi:flavodoxin [Companilactobacillus paralimentarius DSM 13238 = JCM 10415]|uniref:Flavodoxin n=1 Tax=Companilactobacillus paralimentarius DSM 13238 = JCM 10415 TaxID=1122151 RepID=A0A0R1PBL9_9LACO|nr:flavodoxin domain-containing protein [Companilactobacillus paralimentarius]KAE9565572.1 flavodoxin [Companilactobacillus paralimentarius]KRL29710.1 flavodoxin [Companilactobacillus paralimentarius DSM 13238 = JCM 10415]MDR4932676.1 flavodoxin domain-containing protein [Companilactobacillus paralimentarius]QFR69246.1 flavodoxin [Companilactobacillus paralimentarius]